MHCALDARFVQGRSALGDVAAAVARVHTLRMASGNPAPKHFLRQWRKFRGLTLEQAADRAGMTHQNLGKIERGKVPFNETLLEVLATLYRTDKVSLIARDPALPDPFWQKVDRMSAAERELFVKRVEEELAKTG